MLKGDSDYEASFGPTYRPPWPKDLPSQCPLCGTKFITGFNLKICPSKTASRLKTIAIWSIIPSWLLALFNPLLLPLVVVPAILIFISASLPFKRRLECKKCDTEQFYSLTPTPTPNELAAKPKGSSSV